MPTVFSSPDHKPLTADRRHDQATRDVLGPLMEAMGNLYVYDRKLIGYVPVDPEVIRALVLEAIAKIKAEQEKGNGGDDAGKSKSEISGD